MDPSLGLFAIQLSKPTKYPRPLGGATITICDYRTYLSDPSSGTRRRSICRTCAKLLLTSNSKNGTYYLGR